MHIGRWVVSGRRVIPLAWLALAAGLAVAVPSLDPAANEPAGFLPSDAGHVRAAAALRKHFPGTSGLSQAVLIFERADGALTPADLRAIEAVASRLRAGAALDSGPLAGTVVRSPADVALPANPLKSPDARAALVLVHVPANFVTMRSARVVDRVRAEAGRADLPAGLAVAVTGSSGFGHDYAASAKQSHARIGVVTVSAVIVILLLVFRAPLAALVPLAAISLAVTVAVSVLGIAAHLGMHVGTGEQIFVFVLLYGAGMDYSLLFVSRFREGLDAGSDARAAAAEGVNRTFGALLASAGTDTLGLLMLCAAEYRVFRTAGPAIAVALVVALAAAVTLVPALCALLGRGLFWPGGRRARQGRFWPWVARGVTARPAAVLVVATVLLAVPALRGAGLRWVYDALAQVDQASPNGVGNAAAGLAAARRHWPAGEVAPVTVLLAADEPRGPAAWSELAGKLTAALDGLDGVRDVRSLARPVGRRADAVSRLLLAAGKAKVRAEYLAGDGRAMRLHVVLDQPPLSLSAMDAVAEIRRAVEAAAPPSTAVHLAGATPEMIDIRRVTQADFHRVAVLVLAVIFLTVLALLRDPLLAAFIVAATVLSYLATLGLTHWAFAAVGAAGLDWKVEVFLFVVMVAVGVDYSIFLAARVSQEARRAPVAAAVRAAVVHTGPVISSCGVIMAATLGSLMAGDLRLLRQLGLALALGMLLDTFVVRPVLLPAFIAFARRPGRMPRGLE